jgi:surface antigen
LWPQGARFVAIAIAGASLLACAVDPPDAQLSGALIATETQVAALDAALPPSQDPEPDLPPPPHIEAGGPRMQCVPFARALSGIDIRGDAWTWWASAERRYHRGAIPAEGAVLVFKRKGKSFRGHVAVVTHVLSAREIVVDHANWLKGGRIHRGERVRDVSPDNDWSLVRVWYTPGARFGRAPYATYGFIYPVAASARLDLGAAQKSARVSYPDGAAAR